MRPRRVLAEIGPPLVGILSVIVVWSVTAAATETAAIPAPTAVWSAFADGMRDGSIPEAAARTLVRLVFSFVAAVVFGVARPRSSSICEIVIRPQRKDRTGSLQYCLALILLAPYHLPAHCLVPSSGVTHAQWSAAPMCWCSRICSCLAQARESTNGQKGHHQIHL